MPFLCVFCGSSYGAKPFYEQAARQFGQMMAEKGIGLVYGGGNTGLMGTLADAALEANGKVIGVIPRKLVDRERAHKNLTELHIVNSMHERKALMADLSQAFVALPGGLGTFDEFCEILTWNQLRFIDKPAGILNLNGYYNHFIHQLDFSVEEGFITREFRDKLLIEEDGGRLLERII